MGYIYKVENKENGKVYIGQTRYGVPWRWHTHLYSTFNEEAGDYNCLLHKAIRKYGIDSFTVEELESCSTKDLDEREMFWIKRYNSFDKNFGYNMTLGGSGAKLHDDDEIMDLWRKGYAASEISRLFSKPIGRNTVRLRLIGLGVSEEEIRNRGNEAISRSKHKLIYQYKKNGEYIKSYYSAHCAADDVGCNISNISACAAGQIKSAGGYLWSYEKVERLQEPKKNKGLNIVGKYDEHGRIVEMYTSLTAAGNNNSISRKRLALACEREEFYKGYVWKFLEIEGGVIHV